MGSPSAAVRVGAVEPGIHIRLLTPDDCRATDIIRNERPICPLDNEAAAKPVMVHQPLAAVQAALKYDQKQFMGQGVVLKYLRNEFIGGSHGELRAEPNHRYHKVIMLWFLLSPIILLLGITQHVIVAVFPPFDGWLSQRFSHHQTHHRLFYALASVPAFKYLIALCVDIFIAVEFTFLPLLPTRESTELLNGQPTYQKLSPRFMFLTLASAGYLLQEGGKLSNALFRGRNLGGYWMRVYKAAARSVMLRCYVANDVKVLTQGLGHCVELFTFAVLATGFALFDINSWKSYLRVNLLSAVTRSMCIVTIGLAWSYSQKDYEVVQVPFHHPETVLAVNVLLQWLSKMQVCGLLTSAAQTRCAHICRVA